MFRLFNRFRGPRLSLVVVVYKMPDQAEKTLYSLSPAYQRWVEEGEYEVIVVENISDRMLGAARATQHAGNVRYFAREETQRSPVGAVNFGAARARAGHVTIMIDGARMVTPGVVRNTLDVIRIAPEAVVAVPSYHLGDKLQQIAVNEGYDETTEAQMLASINWPEDGYRLFDIGCFSGSCKNGVLLPNFESNALTLSVGKWKALGGMDPRFNDNGGGMVNLDLYKRALELPGTPFYVLPGEGSFHQHHGGVTTGTTKDVRDKTMAEIRDQGLKIRGAPTPPQARPIFYGQIRPPAYRFLRQSLDMAQGR